MITLQVLIVFMIIAAVVAVEIQDLLSSVVSVGAIGLALSLCFLLLKAPDLAVVQLVVEILVLIILIRATMSRDTKGSERMRLFPYVAGIVFISVFTFYGYAVLNGIPEFGHPVMKVSGQYIKHALVQTGSANVVMAVMLDYRVFDTLCRITILLTAAVGVLTVLRRESRKKQEEVKTDGK
ncbi:MAG: hydrogen gas-evolving membrane-bound hydrogenase subunit E [Elusimicrobiota bacterium]